MERNRFVLMQDLMCALVDEDGGSPVRPRVEGDRENEILHAALGVLAEVGYDNLTMDSVAAKAKASKATLYRRWTDKETLVISAFKCMKGEHPEEPLDTGTLRGDLIAAYCGDGGMADEEFNALFTSVITAAMRDPDFAAVWRQEMVGPKLAIARTIWERARDRGEVTGDIDLNLLEAVVSGVVMHRIFIVGQPPDAELITSLIDQIILPALGAHPAS